MSEKSLIEAAFEERVKFLFNVYCDNCPGVADALERFVKGVVQARECRDKARAACEN